MLTFIEANQARLILKMKLHLHAWYNSSLIEMIKNEYTIIVFVHYKNKNITKIIPPTLNGFNVKVEVVK
jgi:hypothetical protein